MLQQPPERSPMEIYAEIAAAAQLQAPPNRAHGCFRLMVWCSPIFVLAILGYLLNSLPSRLLSQTFYVPQIISIPLSLAVVYGIGYFDGMLSRKTFAPQEDQRRSNLHMHACKFLAWQFLIVPGICALFFGACVLIFSINY